MKLEMPEICLDHDGVEEDVKVTNKRTKNSHNSSLYLGWYN